MVDDDFVVLDALEAADASRQNDKPLAADHVRELQAWLQPTDYNAPTGEFRKHLSSKTFGTTSWLFERAEYKTWHQGSDVGTLWIKAVPGAGKSVLAASLIEHLRDSEQVPVLFFFFRHIIRANHDPVALVRDWLTQLLVASPTLQHSLQYVKEKRAYGTDLPSIDELWSLLLLGLRSVGKVYCVVDGLDEMDSSQNGFLQRLSTLSKFLRSSVKTVIFSRPRQDLQQRLANPTTSQLRIDNAATHSDLEVFVTTQLNRPGFAKLRSAQRRAVAQNILTNSAGLFLYARLTIDQLEPHVGRLADTEDLDSVVQGLPDSLTSMYNQMLLAQAQGSGVHRGFQICILESLAASAQPLRLIELASILQAHSLELKTPHEAKKVILGVCGPLIDVLEDETVQPLHHTFTEFLLDEQRGDSVEEAQFPTIDRHQGHRRLLLSCLRTLSEGNTLAPDDQQGPTRANRPKINAQELYTRAPFLQYAVKHWDHHARSYDLEDEEVFTWMSKMHQRHTCHFELWKSEQFSRKVHYDKYISMSGSSPSALPSDITVTAFVGLHSYLKHLLDGGTKANGDDENMSPLDVASKEGYEKCAALLIKHGASVSADDRTGRVALHYAAIEGNHECCQVLLAAGSDPAAPQTASTHPLMSAGFTPIRYAVEGNNVLCVQAMVPYLEDRDLEAAAFWAVKTKQGSKVLRMLLDASPFSPNTCLKGMSLLYMAASSHNFDAVRLLVERGADVQQLSDEDSTRPRAFDRRPCPSRAEGRRLLAGGGLTALHGLALGASYGQEKSKSEELFPCIQLLLGAGADLEARDAYGNTPLSLAHNRSIPPLLKAGADPRATNQNGHTVLHRGNLSTKSIDYLIDAGADPNAVCSIHSTPLHMTTRYMNIDAQKQLLERGANINLRDDKGHTALITAAKHHGADLRTSETLCGWGADVNAQDDKGRTCLYYAYPHESAVNKQSNVHPAKYLAMLIQAGLNLEKRDIRGRTAALAKMGMQGQEHWLPLLVAQGARLDVRDYEGKGGFHLFGPLDLLLEHDLDLQQTDNKRNTMLHDLFARRHSATINNFPSWSYTVSRILELGVDVNAQNEDGNSAVHILFQDTSNQTPCVAGRSSHFHQFLRSCKEGGAQPKLGLRNRAGYAPIHFAAAVSEFYVSWLLAEGVTLEVESRDGLTSLHTACIGRQSNAVGLILDVSPKLVNVQDGFGRTALHCACRSGRAESVSLLLQKGADVSLLDNNGQSALHYCAESAIEKQVWEKLALQHNEETRSHSIDPFRPILRCYAFGGHHHDAVHISCEYENVQAEYIIGLLLGAGVPIDIADQNGDTALDRANSLEFTTMVKTLKLANAQVVLDDLPIKDNEVRAARENIEQSEVDTRVEETANYLKLFTNETLLHAVLHCEFDFTRPTQCPLVQSLVRWGFCDVLRHVPFDITNFENSEWVSATIESRYRVQGARYIFPRHGTWLNAAGPPQRKGRGSPTALLQAYQPLSLTACERELPNLDMIKTLLTLGVNVNARAHVASFNPSSDTTAYELVPGETALHKLAAADRWWKPEAMKLVLESGADPNIPNEDGRTPLHIACENIDTTNSWSSFQLMAIDILLSHGASCDVVTDQQGVTPLHIGCRNLAVMEKLLKHGASFLNAKEPILFKAIEGGQVGVVKALLEAGASPDISGDFCPDQYSHQSNKRRYRFPLEFALIGRCGNGSDLQNMPQIVKLLLEYGANPCLFVDHNAIMHIFVHDLPWQSAKDHIDCLHVLLSRPDIDLSIRNKRGETLLHVACQRSTFACKSLFNDPRVDIQAVDHAGKNYLHHLMAGRELARELPSPDLLQHLLSKSSAKELSKQKDNTGYSPLHYALKSKAAESAEMLLALTGEQPGLDPEGNNALHLLIRILHKHHDSRVQQVRKWIDRGVDLDARNNDGKTPFLLFVEDCIEGTGQERVTDCVWLFRDCDVKVVDNTGQNALHKVASYAHPPWGDGKPQKDAFEALLALEIDPLLEDSEGRTSLDLAYANGNKKILELFKANGDERETSQDGE